MSLTGPDTTQKLQHMWTGYRTAPAALGDAPVEGVVVSATATDVVVTINGLSAADASPTRTCKYQTIYAWDGSANVAQIPPAGTPCLVVLPSNSTTSGPWVIAFYGLSG